MPDSQSLQAGRWWIAALLGCGVLVNYLDRVNLSVAEAALDADFGVSKLLFGFLLGAYSWTYAACQLPSGVLLDRFGVQRIGRVSTLLWSAASFAAALAPGIGPLFAARLLLGIGEAPTFPANAKAVGLWFPSRERGLPTALFDAAAKLGPGIGTPLVGLLLIKLGWRLSFAFTGCVSLLYFIWFFRAYRDPPAAAAPHALSAGVPLSTLLKERKVLGLALGFATYNYTFYLLLTWLPSYLAHAFRLDLMSSVLFTSIPWLIAGTIDLIVGGWLVDYLIRRGHDASKVRRRVLIIGTALGIGILGPAISSSPWATITWITLAIGGLSAAAPVGWSLPALIAPPDSAGRVGGIMNFFSQLAAITAPIVTGYLAEVTHSFVLGFVVAGVLVVFGVLSYLVLLGRIEPVAPAVPLRMKVT
jgi:ACS family D-galactonate transporter-like MFS transporter